MFLQSLQEPMGDQREIHYEPIYIGLLKYNLEMGPIFLGKHHDYAFTKLELTFYNHFRMVKIDE